MSLNRAHPVDLSYDCAVLFVRSPGALERARRDLTNDAERSDRMAEQITPQLRPAVTVIAGALVS